MGPKFMDRAWYGCFRSKGFLELTLLILPDKLAFGRPYERAAFTPGKKRETDDRGQRGGKF
jgi:hypothetical protein